jgi:hypothetical protein
MLIAGLEHYLQVGTKNHALKIRREKEQTKRGAKLHHST